MNELDIAIDDILNNLTNLNKAVHDIIGTNNYSAKYDADIYSIDALINEYKSLSLELLDYDGMSDSKKRIDGYNSSVVAENIVRKLSQRLTLLLSTFLSLKRDMKEHNIKKEPYSNKFVRIDIMLTEIEGLLDQQLEIVKNIKNYYYKNSYEFNGYC